MQNFSDGAVKAKKLATEPANPKGVEIRAKVEGAMYKLGDKWRKHDFEALAPNLWETIAKETGRCMKCYACIDHCPVCVTIADKFKNSPTRWSARVSSRPTRCSTCAALRTSPTPASTAGSAKKCCPSEIPLALFSHAIRTEADKFFEPKLGKSAYTN